MRIMYDAIDPRNIPVLPQMVAGYVDGKWPTINGYTNDLGVYIPPLAELFPKAVIVTIAVFADGVADVLDVENGNATPQQAPGWAKRMRALGKIPTVYCSQSLWPTLISQFQQQGVTLPQWWVANYDGLASAITGAVAHQYTDNAPDNLFDTSVVGDYWPGIDDAQPIPPPSIGLDIDMLKIYYGPHEYILHSGKIIYITGPSEVNNGIVGLPVWVVNDNQWGVLTAAYGQPIMGPPAPSGAK